MAKLLKEKGFNEGCNSYFISDNEIALISNRRDFNNHGVYLSAPTHQMAMKWLRDKGVRICPDYSDVDGKWFAMIGTKKKRTYSGYYDSYEEAVEAALKYALENLI